MKKLISIAFLAVVTVTLIFTACKNSSTNSSSDPDNKDDPAKASEDSHQLLTDEVKATVEKYEDYEITYEDATEKLDALKNYPDMTGYTNQAISYIDGLNASRKAYEKGVAYYNEGDFENAIISFESVVKDDKDNYKAVQDSLPQLQDMYIDQVLFEVEALRADGKAQEALDLISKAEGVLENKRVFKESKKEIKDEIKSQETT